MTQLAERRVGVTSAKRLVHRWQPPPPLPARRSGRLIATVALTTLIVAVPAFLAVGIGWPLPTALPDLADVRSALSAPLATSMVIDALAVVAWAAWAQFVASVVVESVAVARARHSGRTAEKLRIPGGAWSQELARRLIEAAFTTAVATSVGVATFSGTILTPARPAVAAAQESGHLAQPVAGNAAQIHDAAPATGQATGPATATPGTNRTSASHPEYVVQAPHGGYYDSLWDIAEKFLGDGQRWREIYELNESRAQPDGRALTRPDLIRPGWRLQLPRDATGLSTVAPPRPRTAPAACRGRAACSGRAAWVLVRRQLGPHRPGGGPAGCSRSARLVPRANPAAVRSGVRRGEHPAGVASRGPVTAAFDNHQ